MTSDDKTEAEPAKRYFTIDTPGPTYTICAATKADALSAWALFQVALGYADDIGTDDVPLPDLIEEIEPDDVNAKTFDDDGTRRPLSELAIGGVLSSEY